MRRRDVAWDATHVRNGVHIRLASRTRGCDVAVDDGARDGPRCAGRKADAACDTKTHRIAREDVRMAFAHHEMHATCVSPAKCLPRRSRRRPSRRPPRGPCDWFRIRRRRPLRFHPVARFEEARQRRTRAIAKLPLVARARICTCASFVDRSWTVRGPLSLRSPFPPNPIRLILTNEWKVRSHPF